MRSRGFTLLEIVIALVVGGMAVSAAAALLTGLGERADQVRAAGARVDRDANAERLLQGLWSNLRLSADSMTAAGDSMAATFQTWCETVEGWLRPCHARLAVERQGQAFQFVLTLTAGETRTIRLWDGDRGPAGIRYLRDAAHGGSWTAEWTGIVPPQALAAIVGPRPDTLVFPTW